MGIILANIELILKSTILLGIASGLLGTLVMLKKDTLSLAVVSNVEFVASILIYILLADTLSTHITHIINIIVAIGALYCLYIVDKYTKLERVILHPLFASLAFGIALAILTFVDRNVANGHIEYQRYLLGSALSILSFKESSLYYSLVIVALSLVFFRTFIPFIFNKDYQHKRSASDWILNLIFYSLIATLVFELNGIVGVIISPIILIIPAVTARLLSCRARNIAIISLIISTSSLFAGVSLSFMIPKITPGILTTLILGLFFFIALAISYRLKKFNVGGKA